MYQFEKFNSNSKTSVYLCTMQGLRLDRIAEMEEKQRNPKHKAQMVREKSLYVVSAYCVLDRFL